MVPIAAPAAVKWPLSTTLDLLARDTSRERISIGDLLNALGERALAALLFVLAVPNVLPALPGTSAVLGVPLIVLAAQLMLGRPPWLPRAITERSLDRHDFARLIQRIRPWLLKAERALRPRLRWLSLPSVERLIGLLCLLLAIVLMLPVPLGNMLPALAICLLALGLLEHDGLWVLAGLACAGVATTVVWGVFYAMIRSGLAVLEKTLA